MVLSRKTKYAIKALQHLAVHGLQSPVLIQDIAEARNIPHKFLELILLELKKQGLVASRKGKGGGYLLAKDPETIGIGDLIRIMEGSLAPVSCVSQRAYAPCEECGDEAVCGIRSVMLEVRDAMAGVLDQVTLADMLRREDEARRSASQLSYYEI
jgi:Rrf2 family protein